MFIEETLFCYSSFFFSKKSVIIWKIGNKKGSVNRKCLFKKNCHLFAKMKDFSWLILHNKSIKLFEIFNKVNLSSYARGNQNLNISSPSTKIKIWQTGIKIRFELPSKIQYQYLTPRTRQIFFWYQSRILAIYQSGYSLLHCQIKQENS